MRFSVLILSPLFVTEVHDFLSITLKKEKLKKDVGSRRDDLSQQITSVIVKVDKILPTEQGKFLTVCASCQLTAFSSFHCFLFLSLYYNLFYMLHSDDEGEWHVIIRHSDSKGKFQICRNMIQIFSSN